MNKKIGFGVMVSLMFLSLLTSCNKSEYTKLVQSELQKGRQDSLFLGMHFGMSRKEFMDHCMSLNHQHLTTVGLRGLSVLYKIPDSTGTIFMNFFPEFSNDTIYEMRTTFTYENWEAWNRKTQPDSLQNKVIRMFDKWYGPGFIKIVKDDRDTAHVKVTGNRRIVIFTEGEMDVRAIITDLIKENELKK